jgi:hypothetical protein
MFLDDRGLIGDNLEDIISVGQCNDEFIATVLCMHDFMLQPQSR